MAVRENLFGTPALIIEGNGVSRHKTLFNLGMKLRGIDLPSHEIIKELEQYNKQSCQPPISKYDLDRLIISVLKWEFKHEEN